MKARDIMTRSVQTATADTLVYDIARTMVEWRISAVPIVDHQGQVIGIVSDGDLLHRPETGTERRRSRWIDFLIDTSTKAREFRKSHGLRAADVMTRDVVSVRSDTDVAEIADLFETRNIKRVPVIDDGRLVGIVSPRDLIAALARSAPQQPARSVSDSEIQAALDRGLQENAWTDRAVVTFTVRDGVVEMSGIVDDEERHAALRVMAENVAGVHAVRDNLQLRVSRRAFGA
jgi:CBS-domain-containing membrane protein